MDSWRKEGAFKWLEGVEYDVLVSYDHWENEWTVRFSPMIFDGIILDGDSYMVIRWDYRTVGGYIR